MDINAKQVHGIQIFQLRGDLRRGEPVDNLRAEMEQRIGDGQLHLVLDLTEVNMVDSSGIGLIVRTHTTVKQKGGGLKLVHPSKLALQTIKIVGLLNVLSIFDDEDTALGSFT